MRAIALLALCGILAGTAHAEDIPIAVKPPVATPQPSRPDMQPPPGFIPRPNAHHGGGAVGDERIGARVVNGKLTGAPPTDRCHDMLPLVAEQRGRIADVEMGVEMKLIDQIRALNAYWAEYIGADQTKP